MRTDKAGAIIDRLHKLRDAMNVSSGETVLGFNDEPAREESRSGGGLGDLPAGKSKPPEPVKVVEPVEGFEALKEQGELW